MTIQKKDYDMISRRLQALQRVSVQLMSQQSSKALLHKTVRYAMDLLHCDAGSLFLKAPGDMLSFEVAINDSVHYDFQKIKIPMDRPGLATFVFSRGQSLFIKDVYEIPEHFEGVDFDPVLDTSIGYRTRSAIIVPLISTKGKVLGVIQLLNKKEDSEQQWPINNEEMIASMPSFDRDDLELMESFAAVAAASIENQSLYAEIENIFESFVKASVVAIDARDPGTRGHSDRVANLTCNLAKAISESSRVDLGEIQFSDLEIKELLWAGYLHDFGKISVREATLQKEKKLTPIQQLEIQGRMREFQIVAEREGTQRLLDQAKEGLLDEVSLQKYAHRIEQSREVLEKAWTDICNLAKPTVLDEEAGSQLVRLAQLEFKNALGEKECLLKDEEIEALSIKRGCLTPEERDEIESHVTRSWEFLRRIPWGEDLKDIPEIAYSHHELLDGTGYPRKLVGEEIPLRSRIMTVCDIFDALAASDRAYKPALSIEKTLSIIESMVDGGKLDRRFFEVFVEGKIWESIGHSYKYADELEADKKASQAA